MRVVRSVSFHLSKPIDCPYLDGQREQVLCTRLPGGGPFAPENPVVSARLRAAATTLYNELSRLGFRRSHDVAYTPRCAGCSACTPVRVVTERFRRSRSMRRAWNRNRDLIAEATAPIATAEHFALFKRYVTSRHGDGEMAAMDEEAFAHMVEASPVETRLVSWRLDGVLVAAALVDVLDDGLSANYSYFEPAHEARSLGVLMVLWLIETARDAGMPHVYLGYLVEGSRKMDYKARFGPLERLDGAAWVPWQPTTTAEPPSAEAEGQAPPPTAR